MKKSLKMGLKIYRGKTKLITNIHTTANIQIDGTEIEKATKYKDLGQIIAMENRTRQEVSIRRKSGLSVYIQVYQRAAQLELLRVSRQGLAIG